MLLYSVAYKESDTFAFFSQNFSERIESTDSLDKKDSAQGAVYSSIFTVALPLIRLISSAAVMSFIRVKANQFLYLALLGIKPRIYALLQIT